MPCREEPRGGVQRSELFTARMTNEDLRKSADYMQAYRDWERNVKTWDAYSHGAAPYWHGPRPRRPTAPPAQPTIANTAHRQAARIGAAAIYARLQALVDAEVKCSGREGPVECRKIFKRSHGDGYSFVTGETWCMYTVTGRCGIPDGTDTE
jgi:hypothetical protein